LGLAGLLDELGEGNSPLRIRLRIAIFALMWGNCQGGGRSCREPGWYQGRDAIKYISVKGNIRNAVFLHSGLEDLSILIMTTHEICMHLRIYSLVSVRAVGKGAVRRKR
jgi:hypothetical protein